MVVILSRTCKERTNLHDISLTFKTSAVYFLNSWHHLVFQHLVLLLCTTASSVESAICFSASFTKLSMNICKSITSAEG